MDRVILRKLAERAGYKVSQRSTHSVNPAWDWSPKSAMDSSHFRTEEAAWRNLEVHLLCKLEAAQILIGHLNDVIRNP